MDLPILAMLTTPNKTPSTKPTKPSKNAPQIITYEPGMEISMETGEDLDHGYSRIQGQIHLKYLYEKVTQVIPEGVHPVHQKLTRLQFLSQGYQKKVQHFGPSQIGIYSSCRLN